MTSTEPKAVAAEFFARFTANDIDGVLALMTDDATWRIPGQPGSNPSVGTHPKERIGRLFRAMTGQLVNGLRMTPLGMVGEGDTVAVEAESRGELKNGRVYSQQYHLLMNFRDGRICAVREYLDTAHVLDVWFTPPAP